MLKQEYALGRNIRSLINEGESVSLEFKSSARWDEKAGNVNKNLEKTILKTLAGFMNNGGGTLLIGVDDGGAIAGLEKDYLSLKHKNRDGYEQYLMQLTAAYLGADLSSRIHVLFHHFDGGDVCQVYAEPSPHPVYLQDGKDSHFYLRTGNTTHELNIKEAVDYISSQWSGRDSLTPSAAL